jgi:tetratricopeptide (TPR) repeat protein
VDAGSYSSRVALHLLFTSNSFFHNLKIDRLNSLSTPSQIGCLCLSLFFLLFFCIASFAQVPDAGNRKLVHGSIFTAQGQPVTDATVEIRNLQGIKVASSLTDDAGKFEISGTAEPGEYIFLVASVSQITDEQVLLAQPDLELSFALPAPAVNAGPAAGRYIVSAKRLEVPAKARTRLAIAQREFKQTKFDEAERAIDGALRIDPTFAQAFTMRAFIRLAEKELNGAAEDARHAISLDVSDAESYVALAMSCNSLREFQEAEDAAWRALSMRPDSWQGRLELAKSFYGQREFVLALRELDFGNIDFPDAHLVRGNVLTSLGRIQEASEEFKTFLREAPSDPRGEQIRHISAAAR